MCVYMCVWVSEGERECERCCCFIYRASAIYTQLKDQFREAARGPQPRSLSITVHAQNQTHTLTRKHTQIETHTHTHLNQSWGCEHYRLHSLHMHAVTTQTFTVYAAVC